MVFWLDPEDAVICKVCGQERRKIREDGTLATHRRPANDNDILVTCGGSGHVPEGGRVEREKEASA